jgi:hypothetical protein
MIQQSPAGEICTIAKRLSSYPDETKAIHTNIISFFIIFLKNIPAKPILLNNIPAK